VDGFPGAYPSSPHSYGKHLLQSIVFCRLSEWLRSQRHYQIYEVSWS